MKPRSSLQLLFVLLLTFISEQSLFAIDCNKILSHDELIIHFLGDIPEEAGFKLSYSQKNYDDLHPLALRVSHEIEAVLLKATLVPSSQKTLSGEQAQLFELVVDGVETGLKAVWKQHTQALWSSNYRAEVLAYELSDLLGFDLVPATVERMMNGKKGSLQLFYETPKIQMAEDFILAKKEYLNKQELFDYIIDHGDRHFENYLTLEDGSVKSIDNSIAFTGKGGLRSTWKQRKSKIDNFLSNQSPGAKKIIQALKEINLGLVSKSTKKYLGEKDSRDLIKRLSFLKQYLKSGGPGGT